jgi:hypothetical protein
VLDSPHHRDCRGQTRPVLLNLASERLAFRRQLDELNAQVARLLHGRARGGL